MKSLPELINHLEGMLIVDREWQSLDRHDIKTILALLKEFELFTDGLRIKKPSGDEFILITNPNEEE